MGDEHNPPKRQLPKLMACMTKTSLENLRNKALFGLDPLDAKGIRRRQYPLHECLIMELRECGFIEASDYMQDLIYDNVQLVADDDIGIVVDLRKNIAYLEHLSSSLIKAEKFREKDNKKKESLQFLEVAQYYSNREKGILWLAEKFYLAAIAVSSQFLIDGGRQKNCCKYHYAKFLLDKFPGADLEEPFTILTEVRDNSIGRDWLLYESEDGSGEVPPEKVFSVAALVLHGVLLDKAKKAQKRDPARAETLSRLAERRAKDAGDLLKAADAIIGIGVSQLTMNNLNNALKTFNRAYEIYKEANNILGLCEAKMHLAAVMQKLGDHEQAAQLLTDMGAMAMEQGLRRQLGRALHLLGELHLKRERPDLGTHHLAEAFQCFMGEWQGGEEVYNSDTQRDSPTLDIIYGKKDVEVYEEEAEQSRLMMAVSAGQELMASYYNLLKGSNSCTVDQIKVIEWKLSKAGWWVKRQQHDLVPCLCSEHNRTPLDIVRTTQERKNAVSTTQSDADELLERADTMDDMRKLRSSFAA